MDKVRGQRMGALVMPSALTEFNMKHFTDHRAPIVVCADNPIRDETMEEFLKERVILDKAQDVLMVAAENCGVDSSFLRAVSKAERSTETVMLGHGEVQRITGRKVDRDILMAYTDTFVRLPRLPEKDPDYALSRKARRDKYNKKAKKPQYKVVSPLLGKLLKVK